MITYVTLSRFVAAAVLIEIGDVTACTWITCRTEYLVAKRKDASHIIQYLLKHVISRML
jgi:hypothetical protein